MSIDTALDNSVAGEAVRTLEYWPELFDIMVAIAVDQGEFGPHFELGGEG